MATVDNVAAVEWTASWSDNLTHLQAWSGSSGGTFRGQVALGSSIGPASGATVRIPAGDLNITLSEGSGIQSSLTAALLALINASNGVPLWFGWGDASGSSNEVNVSGYSRQQPTFS